MQAEAEVVLLSDVGRMTGLILLKSIAYTPKQYQYFDIITTSQPSTYIQHISYFGAVPDWVDDSDIAIQCHKHNAVG